MNEDRAQEILKGCIEANGNLHTDDPFFLDWLPGFPARLEGDFTLEQIEAIAFYIRSKSL